MTDKTIQPIVAVTRYEIEPGGTQKTMTINGDIKKNGSAGSSEHLAHYTVLSYIAGAGNSRDMNNSA